MKLLKLLSVLVAVAGLAVLAIVAAPSVHGQNRPERRTLSVLDGRGGRIGVSARDLNAAEADRQKLQGGVVIDEVQPDSPAEKAGLERSDIIVEFDGEHVRSARQFSRLVQETAPGRAVKATIVRDGRRSDVHITPSEGRQADVFNMGDMYHWDHWDDWADRLPFNFNFDFDLPGQMCKG
jgi:membrane-associated protease RseP (regulator of RpoE activity)